MEKRGKPLDRPQLDDSTDTDDDSDSDDGAISYRADNDRPGDNRANAYRSGITIDFDSSLSSLSSPSPPRRSSPMMMEVESGDRAVERSDVTPTTTTPDDELSDSDDSIDSYYDPYRAMDIADNTADSDRQQDNRPNVASITTPEADLSDSDDSIGSHNYDPCQAGLDIPVTTAEIAEIDRQQANRANVRQTTTTPAEDNQSDTVFIRELRRLMEQLIEANNRNTNRLCGLMEKIVKLRSRKRRNREDSSSSSESGSDSRRVPKKPNHNRSSSGPDYSHRRENDRRDDDRRDDNDGLGQIVT